MRKYSHGKEGGTGRIKVIYLVIWSQGMPLCHKKREERADLEKELGNRPEERLAPKLFTGRGFLGFFVVVFKQNYGQINPI